MAEYMDLYVKDQKENKFTYFEDWNGFNIPGWIIRQFYAKFKKDLSNREIILLNILPFLKNKKFYIIGAIEGKQDVMKHEIAHIESLVAS